MALAFNSRFKMVPNPPVAGKPLEIIYIGPATEIEVQIDGRRPQRLKPDRNGRAVLESVPAGDEIFLSDNLGIPGFLHAKIVHMG